MLPTIPTTKQPVVPMGDIFHRANKLILLEVIGRGCTDFVSVKGNKEIETRIDAKINSVFPEGGAKLRINWPSVMEIKLITKYVPNNRPRVSLVACSFNQLSIIKKSPEKQ